MPDTFTVEDSGTEQVISVGGRPIATYIYVSDDPAFEAPKPSLSPLRTLDGAVVSVSRPWDHRWHKGLQMTWSHVSGNNFWGGPTFDRHEGYVGRDNLGRIRHDAFRPAAHSDTEVVIDEDLTWISATGEEWLREDRRHRFHSVDFDEGSWQLDFTTQLTNVRDTPLDLGSPTTHGRHNAGYTGWFWRGPRAFTGARVTSADGSGADVMGREAPWIAVSSQHDERDGGATLLFYAGTSSAAVPIVWFVRDEPFAAVNPSPAFHKEIALDPGQSLRLFHRLVVFDRQHDDDEIAALAERHHP